MNTPFNTQTLNEKNINPSNFNIMHFKAIITFILLLVAGTTMAQDTDATISKFAPKNNHFDIQVGVGRGSFSDPMLSPGAFNYSAFAARLSYEHRFKRDFRFVVRFSNEASMLSDKKASSLTINTGLAKDAPYFAFDVKTGFLAPVVKRTHGFSVHLGANYGFNTRFANWEERNQHDGKFTSLSAQQLEVAMQVEYEQERWRVTLGANMPMVARMYRPASTSGDVVINDGDFSPMFEVKKWASVNKYQAPEVMLGAGFKVFRFMEVNLNYSYKHTGYKTANFNQNEHQVRVGTKFSF